MPQDQGIRPQSNSGNSVPVHEFNPNEIISDPALRKQIEEYDPKIQDQVRRAYILKGPNQPLVNFPRKNLEMTQDHFLKHGTQNMIG